MSGPQKCCFYGLVVLSSISFFMIVFKQYYIGNLGHKSKLVLSVNNVTKVFIDSEDFSILNESMELEIDEVVLQQRNKIAREMDGYNYPNGKYGIGASSLDDLVMEKGGRPIRSVIITTSQSGSTFLDEVLNVNPATFHHFEPNFGTVQIRGRPMSVQAVKNINSLFNCDYSDIGDYLEYGKNEHPFVFSHNTYLSERCKTHEKMCWDPRFLSRFCRLFPFQSMKVVGLRLQVAQTLLEDHRLGVRMILLIRDPRGLLESRKNQTSRLGNPDFFDLSLVCNDMVSDYETAAKLIKEYPQTFQVLRYEDFAIDPFTHVENLYKFYGLDFNSNVSTFLKTRTKDDASSTFGNSNTSPFHWQNNLDFEEIQKIQDVCAKAMRLWGYLLVANASDQKLFDPLSEYLLGLYLS